MRDYRDAGLLRLQDELLEGQLACAPPCCSATELLGCRGWTSHWLARRAARRRALISSRNSGGAPHDDGVGRFIDIEREQWTSGSGVDLL